MMIIGFLYLVVAFCAWIGIGAASLRDGETNREFEIAFMALIWPFSFIMFLFYQLAKD